MENLIKQRMIERCMDNLTDYAEVILDREDTYKSICFYHGIVYGSLEMLYVFDCITGYTVDCVYVATYIPH